MLFLKLFPFAAELRDFNPKMEQPLKEEKPKAGSCEKPTSTATETTNSAEVPRGPANRKERKRTLTMNSAFAELRDHIPNVPPDTKLSKIKTLRLAISYIKFLMEILDVRSCWLEEKDIASLCLIRAHLKRCLALLK